jgi:Tautomerase enzyme
MPLIQVDLRQELFDASHEQISRAIHAAQEEALGVPADDLFQVFRPRQEGELKFDPGYNGVDRRDMLLIQVLAVHMHPVSAKRAFFAAVVEHLGAIGIRPPDIHIAWAENGFEDWYAGRV